MGIYKIFDVRLIMAFFENPSMECVVLKTYTKQNDIIKKLTGTKNCYISTTTINAYTMNWL